MEKKKWVLAIAVLIVGILAVYFSFFFYRSCEDEACFNKNLLSCSKAKFIKNSEDIIWAYTILGKKNRECLVNTKILSIKEGKASLSSLEGKDMDCGVAENAIIAPESNIENCHGLLKEELQTQVIKNMHSYILENIGQIKQELNKII
jgi:hypothetical protein